MFLLHTDAELESKTMQFRFVSLQWIYQRIYPEIVLVDVKRIGY